VAALAALTCTLGIAGLAQPVAHAASGEPSASGTETRPFEPGEDEAGTDIPAPRSNAPSHVPSKGVPRPTTLPVAANPAAKAIEGLTLKDQRDSNGGNAFSLEPPDQGLCVSGSQVVEGVNDVFTVYDKVAGTHPAPESYASFFNNGAVEIDRSPDADPDHIYGPFVSDPKCYWDPANGHFYMTVLQLGTDPATGDFDGTSFVDIAVTRQPNAATTDPDDWYLYKLDVANAGGPDTTTGSSGGTLAAHEGCPCLGDQPLIGADTYGFYVTTNEFPISEDGFNGAQVYAFDKAALAAGTLKVQRIENDGPAGLPLEEGTAYSVQPATSPVASEWSTASNGTEYALSALEFTGGFDNRIARWTLTNTQSLTTAHPAVALSHQIVPSEVYGAPPKVTQRPGPYPLGQSLKDKLNLLDSNDDRMNQVVYSGHKLWSGVNTAVKTDNGPTSTGIAYFVVDDAATAGMVGQGYVAVNRSSVMFPAIGVAAGGAKATMVFTLAGPSYFPSTAYVSLTPNGVVSSPVTVYAAGTKPADGFTGYPEYGGSGVERWGDYSAAVADATGTVWLATEYIPGSFGYPPYLANWGTAIGRI
jgi:hypothetical protein